MFSFIYGIAAYMLFLGTFLYLIAFSGNIVVPKTIDSGAAGPIGQAIAVDLALLGIFAAQHSIMARRSFKQWWTRIVPEAVERSTFVVAASLALVLVVWQWQLIPEPLVWSFDDGVAARAMNVGFWLGWGVALVSTLPHQPFRALRVAAIASASSAARCRGRSSARPRSTVTCATHSTSEWCSRSGPCPS